MFCPFCGTNNSDTSAFCASCGKPLKAPTQPATAPSPAVRPQPSAPVNPTPQNPVPVCTAPSSETIPPQYKPLSSWAYVGYFLLFNIPIVGFILQIVFAFNKKNLNRRAYARSYFCVYLLAAIIGLLALLAYFIMLIITFGGMMM